MTIKEQEIQTQNRVASYYEDVRYKMPWSRTYHDWLFSHLISLVRPTGKILDAGCGTGLLAEYLPTREIWGIDISKEMVAWAQNRLPHAQVGDVEDLPYDDNFFDTVFARSIIHHLEQPEKGVEELVRVLKPGGRIIFLDTRDANPFSKVCRKTMNAGEHFSEIHKNMEENAYIAMLERHISITNKQCIGYIGYTLLGFPDVFNGYRYVPFKFALTPALMWVDRVWARTPVLNKLGLGIVAVGEKRPPFTN